MADINFPNSPAINDTYTYQGRTWTWNGIGWIVKQSTLSYSDVVNALGYPPLSVNGGTITGNVYINGDISVRNFIEYTSLIESDYSVGLGKNALTAGPVTINNNVTITIASNSTWTIV